MVFHQRGQKPRADLKCFNAASTFTVSSLGMNPPSNQKPRKRGVMAPPVRRVSDAVIKWSNAIGSIKCPIRPINGSSYNEIPKNGEMIGWTEGIELVTS